MIRGTIIAVSLALLGGSCIYAQEETYVFGAVCNPSPEVGYCLAYQGLTYVGTTYNEIFGQCFGWDLSDPCELNYESYPYTYVGLQWFCAYIQMQGTALGSSGELDTIDPDTGESVLEGYVDVTGIIQDPAGDVVDVGWSTQDCFYTPSGEAPVWDGPC